MPCFSNDSPTNFIQTNLVQEFIYPEYGWPAEKDMHIYPIHEKTHRKLWLGKTRRLKSLESQGWQFFVMLRYGGSWCSPHPLSSHTSMDGWWFMLTDFSTYQENKKTTHLNHEQHLFENTPPPSNLTKYNFRSSKDSMDGWNSLKIPGSLLKTLTKVDTWKTVGNQWTTTVMKCSVQAQSKEFLLRKRQEKKTTLGVSFSLVGKPISNILLSNNQKEKTL